MQTLEFGKRQPMRIWAKQKDTGRVLEFQCVKDAVPIDLTGCTVKFNMKQPNKVFIDATITDAITGKISINLTSSVLSTPGIFPADISITDGNSKIVSSATFEIVTDVSQRDESAIEASDDFSALQTALVKVQNIDNYIAEIADLAGFVGYTDDDIVGVEVDFANRTFTRLAGAINRTPGAGFDSILAFGGRRRCNVTDEGQVIAYYGDPGYIEDGSNGQVMVEQPRFYYKVVPLQLEKIQDGKGYHMRKARYYVSDVPKVGFKLHPAFIKDGKEKNFIYLSAYEGSLYDVSASAYILDDAQIADFTVNTGDKLSSIANAKPISGVTQNLTRRNCGILAENRGIGWSQQYAAPAACSQLLLTVEYASMNSQTAIGRGVVDKASGEGNEADITGLTTLLGNASGSVGNGSVSYRGEENVWGNIWKWVDGINVYIDPETRKTDAYVADHGFTDDVKAEPYKDVGFSLASYSSGSYISAFGYNEEFDYLFLPSEVLGDSALPVGDVFYNTQTGWRVARLGGYWADFSNAGAFYWHVNISSGDRYRAFGGRLVYIPVEVD